MFIKCSIHSGVHQYIQTRDIIINTSNISFINLNKKIHTGNNLVTIYFTQGDYKSFEFDTEKKATDLYDAFCRTLCGGYKVPQIIEDVGEIVIL